jgi:hypothetical protein
MVLSADSAACISVLRRLDDLRSALVATQLRSGLADTEYLSELLHLLAQIRADAELVCEQNSRLREHPDTAESRSTTC